MKSPGGRVLMFELTYDDIISIGSSIPLSVQVRMKLNDAGFEFEDDGNPSLIINENPNPLGTLVFWEDYKTGSLHYRQTLDA